MVLSSTTGISFLALQSITLMDLFHWKTNNPCDISTRHGDWNRNSKRRWTTVTGMSVSDDGYFKKKSGGIFEVRSGHWTLHHLSWPFFHEFGMETRGENEIRAALPHKRTHKTEKPKTQNAKPKTEKLLNTKIPKLAAKATIGIVLKTSFFKPLDGEVYFEKNGNILVVKTKKTITWNLLMETPAQELINKEMKKRSKKKSWNLMSAVGRAGRRSSCTHIWDGLKNRFLEPAILHVSCWSGRLLLL